MSGRAIGGAGGLGVLAIVVIGAFFGVDLTPLLDGQQPAPRGGGGGAISEADRQAGTFVSVTLADTEEVWAEVFRNSLGRAYSPPTLVLFDGVTQSPCGGASGATGPFYCPGDKKVYLDTAFFATLSQRLGAGGDFAAAYVIAHEVGHHVQDELGILGEANSARAESDAATANAISVRIELQADCLAGFWAARARDRFATLEPGDVAEAMNAAAQIGDDNLSARAGQPVHPDNFTHGTSEQRQDWFRRGYDGGDIAACDTFSDTAL